MVFMIRALGFRFVGVKRVWFFGCVFCMFGCWVKCLIHSKNESAFIHPDCGCGATPTQSSYEAARYLPVHETNAGEHKEWMGTKFSIALRAPQADTKVIHSAELMRPTCVSLLAAITFTDFWTIFSPVSSTLSRLCC